MVKHHHIKNNYLKNSGIFLTHRWQNFNFQRWLIDETLLIDRSKMRRADSWKIYKMKNSTT